MVAGPNGFRLPGRRTYLCVSCFCDVTAFRFCRAGRHAFSGSLEFSPRWLLMKGDGRSPVLGSHRPLRPASRATQCTRVNVWVASIGTVADLVVGWRPAHAR